MYTIERPRSWTIVDDLFDWQDEFNRMFRNIRPAAVEGRYPAINAWASKDSIIVDVDIPGVDPKKVDVSIENNELTVSGTREMEQLPKDGAYHLQERTGGEFRRTLNIPFMVDTGRVEAKIKNGILRITLTRTDEDKPKKILIEAS